MTMIKNKVIGWLQKYKYAGLILLIGLILLLLPTGSKEEQSNNVITEPERNTLSVEDRLAEILCMISGAGKVRVMLTVATGEEILYQTDRDAAEDENGSNERRNTVTVTDAQRNETGLVRQINPPVYLGAVVVCQGADDPLVRLAVTQAVSKITGLGADKIFVVKMR